MMDKASIVDAVKRTVQPRKEVARESTGLQLPHAGFDCCP